MGLSRQLGLIQVIELIHLQFERCSASLLHGAPYAHMSCKLAAGRHGGDENSAVRWLVVAVRNSSPGNEVRAWTVACCVGHRLRARCDRHAFHVYAALMCGKSQGASQ